MKIRINLSLLESIGLMLLLASLPNVGKAQPREIGRYYDFWQSVRGVELYDDQIRVFADNAGLFVYNYRNEANPELIYNLDQIAVVSKIPNESDVYLALIDNRVSLVDLENLDDPVILSQIASVGEDLYSIGCSEQFVYTIRYNFHTPHPGDPNPNIEWFEALHSIENRAQPVRYYNHDYWTDLMPEYEGAAIHGNQFFMHYSSGAIWATDISDPNRPQHRAYKENVFQSAFDPTGHLLAAKTNFDGFELNLLATLENDTVAPLTTIGRVAPVSMAARFGWTANNLYLADHDTLFLWNVDDPTNPSLFTSIAYNGVTNCYRDGDRLAVNNGRTVSLYDIENPDQPDSILTIDNFGQIRSISKSGDRLYVTNGTELIRVLDVSDPTEPTEIATWKADWRVGWIDVDSNLAVIAPVDQTRFAILDLVNFEILGTYQRERPGIARISLKDHFVYFQADSVLVLDCRNPARITQAQNLGRVNYNFDQNELFTTDGNLVRVYDVSNPVTPRELTSMSISTGNEIAITGKLLHTVISTMNPHGPEDSFWYYYRIYNIENLAEPYLVEDAFLEEWDLSIGQLRLVDANQGVGLVYNVLDRSLKIVDLIGGGDPHYTAVIELPEHLNSFDRDGDIGYVATNSTVHIFDFTGYLETTYGAESMPHDFSLSAFPNPFNSTVTISFTVGAQGLAPLRLAIYDISGRLVTDLFSGKITPPTPPAIAGGASQTVTWDASSVGAGVYFVRLETAEISELQKIILLR